MSNMSYYRFRNTLRDLRDCYDSDDMFDPEELSKDEQIARKALIDLCHQISSELKYEDL